MKEIVKQYGKTILVLIATVLILGLYFFTKKPNNIFSRTKTELNKMNDDKLLKGKKDIYKEKNKVKVYTKSDIYVNKLYKANEIFYGENELYVKILDIETTKENSCNFKVKKDGEKVIFKKEGIYRVYIHVEDNDGNIENMEMYIGVEE